MCVCIILSFWEQSVCVCVCVHILIHLHSHTDIYAPPNTHTHTHTHPHTHTNTSASRREYLVNMALLLCDGHGGRNERGEYCEHMFAVLQVYPDTITPLLCPAGNLYSQVLYTYLAKGKLEGGKEYLFGFDPRQRGKRSSMDYLEDEKSKLLQAMGGEWDMDRGVDDFDMEGYGSDVETTRAFSTNDTPAKGAAGQAPGPTPEAEALPYRHTLESELKLVEALHHRTTEELERGNPEEQRRTREQLAKLFHVRQQEAQTGTLSSIYVHTKNAADTAAAKKVLGDKMAEHPVPDMKEPSGQQQQQQPTTSKGGESKKRGRGPSGEKQRKQRTKNSKGWRNVSAEVKKYEKENKKA